MILFSGGGADVVYGALSVDLIACALYESVLAGIKKRTIQLEADLQCLR